MGNYKNRKSIQVDEDVFDILKSIRDCLNSEESCAQAAKNFIENVGCDKLNRLLGSSSSILCASLTSFHALLGTLKDYYEFNDVINKSVRDRMNCLRIVRVVYLPEKSENKVVFRIFITNICDDIPGLNKKHTIYTTPTTIPYYEVIVSWGKTILEYDIEQIKVYRYLERKISIDDTTKEAIIHFVYSQWNKESLGGEVDSGVVLVDNMDKDSFIDNLPELREFKKQERHWVVLALFNYIATILSSFSEGDRQFIKKALAMSLLEKELELVKNKDSKSEEDNSRENEVNSEDEEKDVGDFEMDF